jgi:hypothetical protein
MRKHDDSWRELISEPDQVERIRQLWSRKFRLSAKTYQASRIEFCRQWMMRGEHGQGTDIETVRVTILRGEHSWFVYKEGRYPTISCVDHMGNIKETVIMPSSNASPENLFDALCSLLDVVGKQYEISRGESSFNAILEENTVNLKDIDDMQDYVLDGKRSWTQGECA